MRGKSPRDARPDDHDVGTVRESGRRAVVRQRIWV